MWAYSMKTAAGEVRGDVIRLPHNFWKAQSQQAGAAPGAVTLRAPLCGVQPHVPSVLSRVRGAPCRGRRRGLLSRCSNYMRGGRGVPPGLVSAPLPKATGQEA